MSSTISWHKIKALSFDVYGTLIDEERGIAETARATALGPHLSTDDKVLIKAVLEHESLIQKEFPSMRQSNVIAEVLRRYAKDLKVVEDGQLTQADVDQACSEFGSQMGSYPTFPDTVSAMQRLGKHYKLIPLTNIDHSSWAQTVSGPLKDVKFDAVYTAEDIGSFKPDPRNFYYLLDHVKSQFGVAKDELCHVAHSLLVDHRTTRDLGMQSVWVDRGAVMDSEPGQSGENFGYKLQVRTLGELADIIDEELLASRGKIEQVS